MKLVVGFILYEQASAKYLATFLPSLERALVGLDQTNYRLFALDNSQVDREVNAALVRRFNQGQMTDAPPRRALEYVGFGKNLGFSRAYNLLLRRAIKLGAEYFLVINPDTLIDPEAIKLLVSALDQEPSLAAAIPRIMRWDFSAGRLTQDIDSLGITKGSGLFFYPLGQGQPESAGPDLAQQLIIGPDGAAGLFRLFALQAVAIPATRSFSQAQEDFSALTINSLEAAPYLKVEDWTGDQYFDERFFMYKEDCDLAYRLFSAGLMTKLVYSALVYHDRTAFAPSNRFWDRLRARRSKSPLIRAWSFRNHHLIFLKHYASQNFISRLGILVKSLFLFIFALILEQFLLKEYREIWRRRPTID